MQEEAIGVDVTCVTEVEFTLITIPWSVMTLLCPSLMPAIPATTSGCGLFRDSLPFHRKVQDREIGGRSWVAIVSFLAAIISN